VGTVGWARGLAEHDGMRRRCLGVHACDIPVLELDTDHEAVKTVTEACQAALDADGSDAVVRGCAGIRALRAELTERAGVPVVDGVDAAVLTVRSLQSLVVVGLRAGSLGEFAPPPGEAVHRPAPRCRHPVKRPSTIGA
jgi:allantoin racemase